MKFYRPTRSALRKPTRKKLLAIYRSLRRHYGHRGWWPSETPFEVMIGAILTQNTAWRNVEKALRNLKERKRLNLQGLLRLSPSRLADLIRPAGYFNVKARRLKNFLRFFNRAANGKAEVMAKAPTQKLREELLEVNGIGEETADSILLYALEKRKFVVDAYTRRIFTRHRYLSGKETYQEIQAFFENNLPKSASLYNDYHAQIVQAGKDFCRTKPRCETCPLKDYL